MTATRVPPKLFRCPVTGLTVIHELLPEARTVAFGLYVKNGAVNETAKESGVSHFLEHLVFKGNMGNGIELTQAMADLGSHINAYTTDEHTSYYATCLPEMATATLQLLLEILRPKFSSADVAREREVILEEMRQYRDDPGFTAHEKGLQFFAPRHPLTHSIIGSEAALKKLSKSELEAFFYVRYRSEKIALVLTGDTSTLDFMEVLRAFGEIGGSSIPVISEKGSEPAMSSLKIRRGVQRLTKRGILQSHLVAFWPAVSEQDDTKFALELWSDIIGAGSRFAWKLVEPGLVESAGLSCQPRNSTGYVMLSACCEPGGMPTVEHEIEQILKDALSKPIDADELEQAKAMTEFSLSSGFETPTDRMTAHGEHWLTHGIPYPLESELEAFRSVTLGQVNWFTPQFQWNDAAITSLKPSDS